ncbi:hypothetical protein [Paraburkholderia antibiotica]|uniref:Type IV secretion protein Rhs n=1 Tax=Paraburkholderia antibiotica TaxID=2728839 RepID=A0A7X9X3A3_9BURK|nr:hypothetical protein [Paraburkholderia antibiotica]NML30659.1 hypothetical protein [Paraburkholderia antibiotica]
MTATAKPGAHKVGPYTMHVNRIQPTSANRMPLYVMCTPDRWGLRYSDEEKGALAYPVARDYAKETLQTLTAQVQWGEAYFGPPGSTPTLKLQWPLAQTDQTDLSDLLRPCVTKALTRSTAGFGIPSDAVPKNMGIYLPPASRPAGEQGAFTVNDWSLRLNVGMLKAMFGIRAGEVAPESDAASRTDQIEPLQILADTLYHEARHCQQWFWIYALVQQYPDNFPSTPNIAQWPTVLASGDNRHVRINQARSVVTLAASQPIPTDPLVLASLKRMAVGLYLYTLNIWRYNKAGVHYPPFIRTTRELDEEIRRARAHAIDLLQHVGVGGTPIDVDAMVAEPGRCYCDYTARPWENDAFFCGETATAYWKSTVNPHRVLDIHESDQCSRAYELADAHQKKLARLADAAGARTSDSSSDGSQ